MKDSGWNIILKNLTLNCYGKCLMKQIKLMQMFISSSIDLLNRKSKVY